MLKNSLGGILQGKFYQLQTHHVTTWAPRNRGNLCLLVSDDNVQG